MMKNWNGLVKILEVQHRNIAGEVIWEEKNIRNMFHADGQQFVLLSMFTTDAAPPAEYYLGLDNRTVIDQADVMADIEDEPTVNGYVRQSVALDDWTVEQLSGVYRATCTIITFSATGGSWGPVKNLFLTNLSTNSGYLIASVELSDSRTVASGESLSMRMALQLQDETADD